MSFKQFDKQAEQQGCYESDWPELMPLENPELPTFPLEIFPEQIGQYVKAVADCFAVGVDMPAMITLATIAASVQGKAIVEAKKDWHETLSLYTWILAPSGRRKSPVLKEVSRPLLEYEKHLIEQSQPIIQKTITEREILEKQRKQAINDGLKAKAFLIDEQLAELSPTSSPRLLAEDSTSEKLACLMSENNGRIAMFSAEAEAIENIAGKYASGKPDCNIFLKAFSGDRIVQDRLCREPVLIDNPAMTLCFCIQPTIIENLLHKRYFSEVGLLPRFIFSVCANTDKKDTFNNPSIPEHLRRGFHNKITALLCRQTREITCIRLSNQAERLFQEYYDCYENQDDSLSEWRCKLRGQILRVGALINLLDDGDQQTISETSMQAAISFSDYLKAHAKAAFGLLEMDAESKLVSRIVKWINNKDNFKLQELWQWIKGGNLKKPDDIREPLKTLEDMGYIRLINDRPEEYEINPNC